MARQIRQAAGIRSLSVESNQARRDTAVQWHDSVAGDFDSSYATDRRFFDRFQVWNEVLERYSDPDFSALDLGTGSGRLLIPLAERNARVVGIDGSAEMLAICERKIAEGNHQNIELLNADLRDLRELDIGKFDLIVASSILEYIEGLEEALGDIQARLDDGGAFILSMPNGSSLYRRIEPVLYRLFGRPSYYRYVVNVLTRKQLEALLAAHGLSSIECRYTSPTAGLSSIFHPLGMQAFSDNLMLLACRRSDGLK